MNLINDHVFINELPKFSETIWIIKCKYCGTSYWSNKFMAESNIKTEYIVEVKCISEEEKIIKDIIE